MNRTHVSLAIMAAFLPMTSIAEVNIYGKVHLSADSLDDGNTSSTYLSSNSSRFGARGSTDFGDGYSGIFQLEGGVTMSDDGTANTRWGTTRDSYLGLKGGFGTFLAGRLPAANQYVYDANLFADQIGDAGNLTGNPWPGRANNALHYVTPSFAGVSLALTHVMEQGVKNADANGARITYKLDKLALAATWLGFGEAMFGGTKSASVTALSAGYDFGVVDLKAMAVQNKAEGGVDGADRGIYTVGASFKVGPGALKAQYSSANEGLSGANDKAKMIVAGYDYPLFKNTTVYAAYAKVSNSAGGSFHPFNWGHGANPGVAAPGDDPSGFSIGMIYDF